MAKFEKKKGAAKKAGGVKNGAVKKQAKGAVKKQAKVAVKEQAKGAVKEQAKGAVKNQAKGAVKEQAKGAVKKQAKGAVKNQAPYAKGALKKKAKRALKKQGEAKASVKKQGGHKRGQKDPSSLHIMFPSTITGEMAKQILKIGKNATSIFFPRAVTIHCKEEAAALSLKEDLSKINFLKDMITPTICHNKKVVKKN